MNLFALSGILAGLSSTVMAAFILLRGSRKVHYLWGFFCISVAIWGFGGYQIATAPDPETADWWWRITHIGIIFIPILFTHFVYEFLNKKKTWFILTLYLIGLGFLVANFTDDLFIANMRWVFDQFYYDSPPGPLYIPFTLFFFGLVIYSHYKLWLAYKTTQGLKKFQIKYFLYGTFIGFAGGGLSFLPVYEIDIYPALNILVFLYPIVIGYAIFKYRLMDIRIAARKIFIYLGLAALAYGLFYLIAWFYQEFLGDVFSSQGFLAGLIIAPLFVLLLFGTEWLLRYLADQYLFAALYDSQTAINRLIDKLTHHIDVTKIVDLITITIKDTLGLNRAGVLLRRPKTEPAEFEVAQVIGFDEQNGIALVQDNFLTQHLTRTQKPLVLDELTLLARDAQTAAERENFRTLEAQMRRIEASLCLPLMTRGELIGIVVLGAKLSGDAYTTADLELLTTMAKQAGSALENARLHQQVEDFNHDLQNQVDQQTTKLRAQAKHLEKLLKIRSEFLDIASHQLRTPVSVILGYSSMLLEDPDLEPTKRKEFLQAVYQKSRKMELVIRNIMTASEADSAAFFLPKNALEEVQLEKIAKEQIAKLQTTAQERKVELVFQPPAEELPPVLAQPYYLEQAVFNLIDNAVNYSPGGRAEVTVDKQAEQVCLTVTDTGVGIPPADRDKLFKKFSRGGQAVNTYTDGSGLGLFIIKRIMDIHGGQVDFSSQPGEGSAFTISLPIARDDQH